MKLTHRQRIFVEEYLRCWNATQAARRAGYSERSARAIGHENLTKPAIRSAIDARLSAVRASATEVLARLSEQARAEYAAYLQGDGSVDLERMIADGKGHLVRSVKQTQWGLDIEFHDAQAALILLLRYHGLMGARGTSEDPLHIMATVFEELRAETARAAEMFRV